MSNTPSPSYGPRVGDDEPQSPANGRRSADTWSHDLGSFVSGDVLSEGDVDFASASENWDYPVAPDILFRPSSTADLVAAVQWANAKKVELAVRSGGHGQWVHSPGGLLIDMADFNQVEVSNGTHVRVGAGARWGDVADALDHSRLVVSSGDTRSVGVGGGALGGGIGWLVRAVGLASDQLVQARIVTATGDVVFASEVENPELFFAIRGGGGNFGIATQLDFEATKLAGVVFATAPLDEPQLASSVKAIRNQMRLAARELNVTVEWLPPFGPTPHPQPMVRMLWAGEDERAARAAFGPILSSAGVGAAEIVAQPYASTLIEPPPTPPGDPLRESALASLFTALSDDTIDLAVLARRMHPTSLLEFRFLGGALGDVPRDATAFSWRGATALVYSLAFLPADSSDAELDRVHAMWLRVTKDCDGLYGPLTGAGRPSVAQHIHSADTLRRLREAKTKWDPSNVFRRNHNVEPMGPNP